MRAPGVVLGVAAALLVVAVLVLYGGSSPPPPPSLTRSDLASLAHELAEVRQGFTTGTTETSSLLGKQAGLVQHLSSRLDDITNQLADLQGRAAQAAAAGDQSPPAIPTTTASTAFKWYKPVPPLMDRGDIGGLLQSEGFEIGVELGVHKGWFAEQTLRSWHGCKKYYLVDMWAPMDHYKDLAGGDAAAQRAYLAEAKQRVRPYGAVPIFMQGSTKAMSVNFQNESIDFVYIDARHDYGGAREDIELYWPKVRPGGILAGHDFLDSDHPQIRGTGQDWSIGEGGVNYGKKAVRSAVMEFAAREGRQISVTYEDKLRCWVSWMVRK